ncbi:hypothetical protein RHMOL_Rhmol04G0090600 [Rhododendron molle]|uniref:Uncharacterized protein n=1 Tax=Rhododendron molle TaxID=49168 RepID=A0ACC0NYX7_RHOML|nr:hypothetical protein RHMOL_Rhmol04G0090600 [Rhododendron molle]
MRTCTNQSTPVHATYVDTGTLRIRLNAPMSGFARTGNNEITVSVNDAEKCGIDPQDAQQTLEIAEANLKKAEGNRQE